MFQNDLCCAIEGKGTVSVKTCADVFEAIIGVLYYYLTYLQKTPDVLTILHDYIRERWITDRQLAQLFKGESLDTCKIDNQTVRQRGLKYKIPRCASPAPKRVPKGPAGGPVVSYHEPTPSQPPEEELVELIFDELPEEEVPLNVRLQIIEKGTDRSWVQLWKDGPGPSYNKLEMIYYEIGYKLRDNTFVVYEPPQYQEYGVAIKAIDFEHLVLSVDAVGTGETVEEATEQAAQYVLEGIYRYYGFI